jgi:peptidoglycan/LPS O-acetylase OafA/YrhL
VSGASRLGDFRGRDNNFNLLRIIAALLVVAAHAFSTGGPSADPLQHLFDIGSGDLGVDIFFILSGFLVTKSFAGKSLAQFAWARCMRIFPGLWISTVVTVLVAGLFFSDLPPQQFFVSRATLTYFAHNFTMLPGFGAQETLAHVFGRPEVTVNVPLWTLPHELQMYMLLAAVGVTIGLLPRYVAPLAFFGGLAVLLAKVGGIHLLAIDRGRFIAFFFAGSLAYLVRERIVLAGWIAAMLAGVLIGTVLLTSSMLIRQTALVLTLPYLVLWCGYIPRGFIRQWNRLGDYSYGIYIYGFPIQVVLTATGTVSSPVSSFAGTLLFVVPVAVMSWHLLEQHALRIPLPGRRAPVSGKSVSAEPDAVGS